MRSWVASIPAVGLLLAIVCLAGCIAPAPPPRRSQPLGVMSSFPPADNSFVHLRCLPTTDEGPGTTCTRLD